VESFCFSELTGHGGLQIAWLVYHVSISALNSTAEMMAHIVFLIIVSVLLFLPTSSAYFRDKK
jgi:hypothetical protein